MLAGKTASGGSITFHAPTDCRALTIDKDDQTYQAYVKRRQQDRFLASRPWSTPNPSRPVGLAWSGAVGPTEGPSAPRPSREASAASRLTTPDQRLKIQNWLSEKCVRGIQEKADPEAKETKKMYMSVLNEEDGFVREMEQLVKNKEFLDLRKKEILHKRWQTQIGDIMEQQVYREAKTKYPGVEKHKRALYDAFVEYGNTRPVFLETVSLEDYDPFSLQHPRPAPIVADVGKLDDPIIAQEKDRNQDDRVILRCMTGRTFTDKAIEKFNLPKLPLVPLGRHGTECKTWIAMPRRDVDSQIRLRSRRRMRSNFNDSNFSIDWAKLSCDPAIVDREMQVQKNLPAFMLSV